MAEVNPCFASGMLLTCFWTVSVSNSYQRLSNFGVSSSQNGRASKLLRRYIGEVSKLILKQALPNHNVVSNWILGLNSSSLYWRRAALLHRSCISF